MADELDVRQSPLKKKIPAWQLREKMKRESTHPSVRPAGSFKPKTVDSLDDGIDPTLPPAFRAMAIRKKKQDIDDFNSLDSVHSSKSQMSTKVTTPTTDGFDSDSDSFDGHDSFASLGSEDDDDEAYREGRNQIARQTIEDNRSSKSVLRSADFRKKGVMKIQGTPLDFIAE